MNAGSRTQQERKRQTPHVCPRCRSSEVERASEREKKQFGGFQLMPLCRCRHCGHLWEPTAPAWVLGAGAGAGFVAIGLGIVLVLSQIFVGTLLIVVGGGAVATCLTRRGTRR